MNKVKNFNDFVNEDYTEDDLVEMSGELDGLYDEGADAIVDAVVFLEEYYKEIGEDFDEDTINDSMDVKDAIAELQKVSGDKQQEAENIVINIQEINDRIKELSEKIGDY
jgi:hypothetical protein